MIFPEGIARGKFDFSGGIHLRYSRTVMHSDYTFYYTGKKTIIQNTHVRRFLIVFLTLRN